MPEIRATTTVTWKKLLVLAAAASVVALASPSQLPAVGQGLPVGLQANCTTICGDLIVPYPFGITAGCYLPGYNLTCDTSHMPPRLFLGDGTLQVMDISLENSTVRVVGPNIPILKSHRDGPDGYNASGTWGGEGWGLQNGPYILSEEDNVLVVLGCMILAELVIIDKGRYQQHECQTPLQKQSRRCQWCSGFGCCEMLVPTGWASYDVRFQSLRWTGELIMPSSVFISEQGWFDRTYNNSNEPSSGIPAILAWAIVSDVLPFKSDPRDGNATCPTDTGSTSCHGSYSTCRNIGRMYHKSISRNPYIPNGCQGNTSRFLLHLRLSALPPPPAAASIPEVMAVGILTASFVLFLGVARLMQLVYWFVPLPVVRGIQLAQGLNFTMAAVKYIHYEQDLSKGKSLNRHPWTGLDGRILAIAAICFILLVNGAGSETTSTRTEKMKEDAKKKKIQRNHNQVGASAIWRAAPVIPSTVMVFVVGVAFAVARHPAARSGGGVCPYCLRDRLLRLCPNCVHVRPCSCAASCTSPSSSLSVSGEAVGRVHSLIEREHRRKIGEGETEEEAIHSGTPPVTSVVILELVGTARSRDAALHRCPLACCHYQMSPTYRI
nr:unnamed protein product [Digitaria exilis]